MSSELINLLIDQYKKYEITRCIQIAKNIKEFYKLIQQDLEISNVNIVIGYRYSYHLSALLIYSIYISEFDNLITISTEIGFKKNLYTLKSNNLYICDVKHAKIIMTKEMYEKILNSLNNY